MENGVSGIVVEDYLGLKTAVRGLTPGTRVPIGMGGLRGGSRVRGGGWLFLVVALFEFIVE